MTIEITMNLLFFAVKYFCYFRQILFSCCRYLHIITYTFEYLTNLAFIPVPINRLSVCLGRIETRVLFKFVLLHTSDQIKSKDIILQTTK